MLPNLWAHQYVPLEYVWDDAFSGVMCVVNMDKLFPVVFSLPNDKTTGLSGIPNELWKHSGEVALRCLLELLNVCLTVSLVPALWKRAWVSMIHKPYDWDGVLTNTWLIALIETARKILFKILSDRISVACSKFNVLQDDNFLVLKGMFTQSLVFAVGSVVENALERIENKAYYYLDIFLFTERLSKLSVAKAHANVCFFVNVVLRKAIKDKQFLYLVSAVLQPIVSYCIQFSFVSSNVCRKWDVLVRKGLKSKACLFCDFPDAALHHSSLYDLKHFEQMQSEGKVAALIMFSNAPGILGHLFSHRFLDLQVLGWAPLDPLQFPVRLYVSLVNNFLAELVRIFLDNELFLANNLPTAFHNPGHFFLSSILEKSLYFDSVKSLKHFGVAFGDQLFDKKGGLLDWRTFRHWKRLDPHGPVPHWSVVASEFFLGKRFLLSGTTGSVELCGLDVLGSNEFSAIKDGLHDVWLGFFEVYTDEFLKNAGSVEIASGIAAYFPALDLSIGVAVWGLLSFIMAELQAVALSLECVPSSSTMVLHLDSQAVIDTCVSEMSFATSDFHNQCWLERYYIFNLVRNKDLNMSWAKIKGHSGIPGNVRADLAAGAASGSLFSLLANVRKHFLVAEGTAVSGNACHFVWNIFWSVCYACWEAGPGCDVVPDAMVGCVDWVATARVWHLDSYMLADFTSCKSSTLHFYIMKAVHRRLPMAVKKRLYNRCYSGVLCLLCGGVKFFDHAFTYVYKSDIHNEILAEASACWSALAGVFDCFSSVVLWVLSQCSIDVRLYALVCKRFVLDEWHRETCCVFDD
ncbi:hypothetical protein G9A89_010573 [Geosiphon pyriformis]|nr:hypothetical protein G9A89_010573 [Geosiphon pyriformis]